jgi:transcriptional regulator with XRE-family HTH domain
MRLPELLTESDTSIYRLAKNSGVPYTTVREIYSGKTEIEKCSGETLYKLAKALDVPIETLLEDAMEHRPGFKEQYPGALRGDNLDAIIEVAKRKREEKKEGKSE